MTKTKLNVLQEQVKAKPEDPDHRVHRENIELLANTLPNELAKKAIQEYEDQRVIGFGLKRTPEPASVTTIKDATTRATNIFDRIQQNASAFSQQADKSTSLGGADFEIQDEDDEDQMTKEKDIIEKRAQRAQQMTQEKVAFDEEIDEGGANVATADTGTGENLYGDAEQSLFNVTDDDEDDEGPTSRATVGTESEFDDDTNKTVPKHLRDEDDED